MFRERARTLQRISITLDVCCILVAFVAACVLRALHDQIPLLARVPAAPWPANELVLSDLAVLLGASLLAWILSLRRSGVHLSHRNERMSSVVLAYTKALVLACLVTGAASFALKMSSISRLLFAYYFGIAFVLLVAKQLGIMALLRQLRSSGYNLRHALVIGAREPARWFASVLEAAVGTGYDLVGILVTHDPNALRTSDDHTVLGDLGELESTLASNAVDEVFLVGGARDMAELAPIAQKLIETGRVVSLITPLSSGTYGMRGRVTEFSGVPMISFGPMPRDELDLGIRRVVDVTAGVAGLIVLAPLLLATAIVIKLLDPGPVLFRQERLGQGGRPFDLYKFRSMRVDAEDVLRANPELHRRYVRDDYKLPENEDPRISRLGRFLRKSSLDELPQLWNVVKGEMTLVGPRPIVPPEIERYAPYAEILLSAKPGVTGEWQVTGRSNVKYPQRAFMDLDYAGSNSLGSYFSILARTLPAVLGKKGAY